MSDDWRTRLRDAIKRSRRKQSDVAWRAQITPVSLSRVLNAVSVNPFFGTVVGIAHAVDENVGWLLDERGFHLSRAEQAQLRDAAQLILALTSTEIEDDVSAVAPRAGLITLSVAARVDEPDWLGTFAAYLDREEARGTAVRVRDSTMQPVLYADDFVRVEQRAAGEDDIVCMQVRGQRIFGYRRADTLHRLNAADVRLNGGEQVLGVVTAVIVRDLTRRQD
jgi:hypothetical protein